jgi:glutamate dehydrogenase
MNHLLRHNVHQVPADIFIPCGGRPRTLNENNYQDFLDDKGHPTARAIIEGGNLYLSQEARVALEKAGTIIIKDSSANKGGVICSSFEVLAGLVLSEQEFIEQKEIITKQILDVIESRARDEAQTLLSHFGSKPLTQVSEDISQKINSYTDELFAFLKEKTLSLSTQDLWTQVLLNYALPVLRERYSEELMKSVPDIHKKAMMACFVAQRLVYRKGLDWAPSILDILPLVLSNKNIVSP